MELELDRPSCGNEFGARGTRAVVVGHDPALHDLPILRVRAQLRHRPRAAHGGRLRRQAFRRQRIERRLSGRPKPWQGLAGGEAQRQRTIGTGGGHELRDDDVRSRGVPRESFRGRYREPCIGRRQHAHHQRKRRVIVMLRQRPEGLGPHASIAIADRSAQPCGGWSRVQIRVRGEAAHRPEADVGRAVVGQPQQVRQRRRVPRTKQCPGRAPPQLDVL